MLFADSCRRHGSESYVERGIAGGAVQLLGTRLRPYLSFLSQLGHSISTLYGFSVILKTPEQAEQATSNGLSELPASTTVLQ